VASPDGRATARDWFARRTFGPTHLDPAEVAALKDGRRVSVVLPARDEGATVGTIVTAVRERLVDATGLVDEVLVIDSRSTDDTVERARAAGAVVRAADDGTGPDGGKGAAMRAGVQHMTGDVGVFLDADVLDFGVDFVTSLLGPLLADPTLALVKGFYDRPWNGADSPTRPSGGGRVTELVARPHLQRRAPDLAAFAQPLAGECAFHRDVLRPLRLVSGYGVDIGLLLQVAGRHGLDALAQVDLGRRVHRHQDLDALGRMALQVAAAFELVLDVRDEVVDVRTTVARGAGGAPELREERVATWLLDAAGDATVSRGADGVLPRGTSPHP
jgi:glucosyl-3-phosphoglycerate synthase